MNINTETINQTIKGYDLRDRIGAGGFGAVYRAYQSTVGREVAIKFILPGFANQPEFIRRFEAEAQVVARLEHPHITPLYDYWRDPDGAYLVMRYIRGGTLHSALQNGPYELRPAALLLDQIAGALSLAHRNGVIHRDIKPGNILLDEDGNAYLTDFGIAKDLNLPTSHTQQDAIVGSLDYISPEQARGEPVTPRTDIYSLGVTMFEVITGHHPFENISPIERLYKHINDPLPLITTLDDALLDAINRVIQKATAKNPEKRYPDALAFAADFREAIGLNRASTAVVELLTIREQEILQLIIEGLSNKEIAARLTVTVGTVKWYVNQIYGKLGVRSRVQAIVRARELNLIVRPGEVIEPIAIPTEDFRPDNPYKGLRAFQAADYQDFYGREKVTSKLVKRLGEVGDYCRFLAVIGPSGSGKSSLVKAGLIPSLWRGELPGSETWFVVEMLPGSRPLDELEIALTKIAANQSGNLREQLGRDKFGLARVANLILPDDGSELALVIDQFEEVFTLLEDESARAHFLDLLYAAVTEPRSRVRVIVTLRADFYDRPLHYPQFGELVRNRLETIMPLTAEELESAIARPAERVGVSFEPGLVAAIIGDVNYQPGALPLLQYALTELFERRTGRLLTREAYTAIGGTVGALAKRAEEVYQGLDETGREMVRQLFLRLVTLGEGAEDTRRRAPRSELLAIAADEAHADGMDEIIDTFAAYRLLALDTDPGTRTPTVEVAHEALLREWERLRVWLNDSRDEIRLQRQLAAMAAEWKGAKQDTSFLASGSRLEQFETWAAQTGLALTGREHAYLDASIAERERQNAAEVQRQAREKSLERRSQTFLRGLVAVLLIATLGAFGLTALAFDREGQAQTARNDAVNAFRGAERQRLALLADQAMDDGANGNVGFALALQSLQYGYNQQADTTLLRAVSQGAVIGSLPPVPNAAYSAVYSPDGLWIATSGEDGTRIYDAVTRDEVHVIPDNLTTLYAEFSPDSTVLFTVNHEMMTLWDVATWRSIRVIANFHAISYYFNLNHLFVHSEDTVLMLDFRTGDELARYPAQLDETHMLDRVVADNTGNLMFIVREEGNVLDVTSADTGETMCRLFAGGGEEYVYVLSLPTHAETLWLLQGNVIYLTNTNCTSLGQFSVHPEGSVISWWDADIERGFAVTGDNSNTVIQWDLKTGREITRYNVTSLRTLDLAPDGQHVLISDWETPYIWDTGLSQEPRKIITGDRAIFPTFAPDGESILVKGFGGSYSRWSLDGTAMHTDFHFDLPIRDADLSPDGRYLAVTIEQNTHHEAYLLDAASGEIIHVLRGHTQLENYIRFSPDGTRLLSSSFDTTLRTWDVATGQPLQVFRGLHSSPVGGFYSPDGRRILSVSVDGQAGIWDAESAKVLRVMKHEGSLAHGDFSPDGRLVATANTAGSAHVWEVETGKELHNLIHPNVVFTVEFSPDGRQLLTVSWDGKVRLWDVVTGDLVRVLDTGMGEVYSASFSPDGKYIVSGNGTLTAFIQVWKVDLDDVIASYCMRHPLELSEQQRTQYGIPDDNLMCPHQ